jgi:hypothetical protein
MVREKPKDYGCTTEEGRVRKVKERVRTVKERVQKVKDVRIHLK